MSKSNHSAKTYSALGGVDTPGKLASRFLQRGLNSVQRLLKVAASDWQEDDEHVHQLRVSARRALATIHFFQELIPKSQRRWFRKKLKTVLRMTQQARELDVLMKENLFRLGEWKTHLPRKWKLQRQEAQESIITIQQKLARNHKFRRHIRNLENVLRPDGLVAPISGRSWCIARFEKICRQFSEANSDAFDSDSLHRLRIRTKQLRYVVDVVEQATNSRKLGELKTALAEMQEQLGRIQDHIAAKALLQESLHSAKKSRDKENLSHLIDSVNRMISAQTAVYRSWLKSRDGRKITECLEAIPARLAEDCRAR